MPLLVVVGGRVFVCVGCTSSDLRFVCRPRRPAATLAFVRPFALSFVRKIVDIIHPGVANVSKSELGEMIAKVSRTTHNTVS